jgi:hypothetical protein
MMKFFRKHRNTLMIVIAVLAIPFIFYFNKTDFSVHGQGDFGTFHGRRIPMVEAQRYAKLYGLATQLGMTDFIKDLTFGAQGENDRIYAFIYNLLILRRESERLGIQPTAPERVDFVRNLAVFRGVSGAFDVAKYNELSQDFLAPNGLTDDQVEDLARDGIALRRLKDLVDVGVSVPDSETKENYDRVYGRISASVLRLRNADFGKDIKVSDDDIKKYFDSHKEELKSEEKRKIEYVSLTLGEDQKKLTGKDRVDALQKLADRANDFIQALLEKGQTFQQVASKFPVPVQSTGEFTANKPDPKLGQEGGQITNLAFQLTNEDPNSEPISVGDGYYIVHLAGISPARPLTMDEAKPKIVDSIKAGRTREAMALKASQAVHDLREDLKAGQPLASAAEKVNLKAEKIPTFTMMPDDEEANKAKEAATDMLAIRNAVAMLQPGDVSDFYPWEDGGIIAVLEKREPPDDAKYGGKKKELADRIKTVKRSIVFDEWLQEKQHEAGILKSEPTKSS